MYFSNNKVKGVLGVSRGFILRRPETWNSVAIRTAPISLGQIVPRVPTTRVTPFIPRERPNVKHYCRLLKATTAYISACTDAGSALAQLLSGESRVRHWQSTQRFWPDTSRLQLPLDDCCRLVLPYSMQQTEQIPNDPPRMGAKSTTISNHPSTPGSQVV